MIGTMVASSPKLAMLGMTHFLESSSRQSASRTATSTTLRTISGARAW